MVRGSKKKVLEVIERLRECEQEWGEECNERWINGNSDPDYESGSKDGFEIAMETAIFELCEAFNLWRII